MEEKEQEEESHVVSCPDQEAVTLVLRHTEVGAGAALRPLLGFARL